MTHNRSNTTGKFTPNKLGESMTPRLSKSEQERRQRDAEFEARQELRKKNRVTRHNSKKSKMAFVAIALFLLAIVGALFWHCYQANANVAESLKQEYVNDSVVELPNGEFVDREDYERANEEAHQAELEMLGLEG